jgi:hypothetical protein
MPAGQVLHSVAEWVWGWAQEHPWVREGIVKMFKRPRLVLSFPVETDGWCNQVVACGGPTDEVPQLCRYIRIKIENTGRSLATGCHVYIDTVSVNGREAIARDLSNDLSWKDRESFDPVALPPKIPAYVNVCFAKLDACVLAFTTRAGFRGAHVFRTDGEYEVWIRAEGENFVSPGEIVIRVFFNQMAPLSTRAELVSARGDMRVS